MLNANGKCLLWQGKTKTLAKVWVFFLLALGAGGDSKTNICHESFWGFTAERLGRYCAGVCLNEIGPSEKCLLSSPQIQFEQTSTRRRPPWTWYTLRVVSPFEVYSWEMVIKEKRKSAGVLLIINPTVIQPEELRRIETTLLGLYKPYSPPTDILCPH